MKIIISEKEIAGRRIAELLSNGKAKEKRGKIPVWEFKALGDNVVVIPLKGHVMEVDFPKKYNYWKSYQVIKSLTTAPFEYKVSLEGIDSTIKAYAKKAKEVIIATDSDREGEAIGKEALDLIQKENPGITIKRAHFSTITKKELDDAFNDLKEFDRALADSANARREIDLIWGAALTRFVSLVSGRVGSDFLSVGRVQTPTLKIVVDRELERKAFTPEKYWVLSALLEKNGTEFEAIHEEGKFKEFEKASKLKEKTAEKALLSSVKKSKKVLSRPTPFNTTDFLRAASAIGVGASTAMHAAEHLYMHGYTSYPRTDCNVYPASLDLKEILTELSKSKELGDGAKELLKKEPKPSAGKKNTTDHPPIHPVSAAPKDELNPVQWKVYELIVKRFYATLSEDAVMHLTRYDFDIAGEKYHATGQIIDKAGWKKHYTYSKSKEFELPEMEKGDKASVTDLKLDGKETQPPGQYSQGTLIKEMEEKNLGTKSTRAEIIQKLYDRRYIEGAKQITPSQVSLSLVSSLQGHAPEIATHEMTAALETEMDEIASGKKSLEEVVNGSRSVLSKALDVMIEDRQAIGKELRESLKLDSVLGPCQKCGKGQIIVRRSRFGKRFAGCNAYPECVTAFPLPGTGMIDPLGKQCPKCGTPVIHVKMFKKRGFDMCLYPECETKAEWGKKKAKKGEVNEETAKKA